jgi:toxin ParE1/3/4
MLIRWTPSAASDLEQISSYIEKNGSLVLANRACRALRSAVHMLRKHPHLGKPGKRVGTREMLEGKYLIVYRIQSDAIDVLRIWHSAQERT